MFLSRKNKKQSSGSYPESETLSARTNNPSHQEAGALVDERAASPIAIIYRSEFDYLSRCVLDYPDIETGGQLFGFWTSQGVPVVLYAIGPGRYANHQPTFFNQDSQYLMTVGNALLDKYALCQIGEWHSHHQLGLARPSGHDATTMFHGLQRIPQRRLLLCICNYERGRSTINPYTFHENHPNRYVDALWQVIDMESPFRPIIDHELRSVLIHPFTKQPSHGHNRVINPQPSTAAPEEPRFKDDYWLNRPDTGKILKQMLDFTKEMVPTSEVMTQINEEGIVQFYIDEKDLAIRFPSTFPVEQPELYFGGRQVATYIPWEAPATDQLIFDAYRMWLSTLQLNSNRSQSEETNPNI